MNIDLVTALNDFTNCCFYPPPHPHRAMAWILARNAPPTACGLLCQCQYCVIPEFSTDSSMNITGSYAFTQIGPTKCASLSQNKPKRPQGQGGLIVFRSLADQKIRRDFFFTVFAIPQKCLLREGGLAFQDPLSTKGSL